MILVYFLVVFFIPLYFAIIGKGLAGLRILAATTGFLILFLATAEATVYVIYKNLPDQQTKRGNQNNIHLYESPNYSTPDELIKKSEQVRSDNDRLINQRLKESKESKDSTRLKQIDLETEYKMAPYTIDINTGERTPINP
jgi:hypothetical protein